MGETITFNNKIKLVLGYLCTSILLIFLSFYIGTESVSFPDYPGYDRYIVQLLAFERFSLEPISALFMYIIGFLGFGAKEYYILSIFFIFVVFRFSLNNSLTQSMYWISLLYLCLNPMTLILLQTPRFCFAMGFGLLAFKAKNNIHVLIWLTLSMFSHTVMGVFLIVFFIIRMQNRYWILISFSILSVLGFYYITFFFDSSFSAYGNFGDYIVRGRGRLLYFSIIMIPVFFLYRSHSSERFYFKVMFFISIVYFLITPFSHRIFIFFSILVSLYLVDNVKNSFNVFILNSYMIASIFVGASIIFFGVYGY